MHAIGCGILSFVLSFIFGCIMTVNYFNPDAPEPIQYRYTQIAVICVPLFSVLVGIGVVLMLWNN